MIQSDDKRLEISTYMYMSITTLVVIFSAPMPKSPGGVVVRASDQYSEDPGSIPG